LFVYVGTSCSSCQLLNPELQKLASEKSKLINVVLVYDHSSRDAIKLKDSFAETESYEYLDQKGYMYHYLFTQPQYMSYVLTGPKHTIISEGRINQISDIQNLKPLITNN
jgi:thiol-disulfide isomerase/thioredoxin